MNPQHLQVETLPLTGRHLIEASAGTGKTYNITRIFLRLLLERQLEVEQILVMTFTRAATEELKGRIATLLRQVLEGWDQLDSGDPLFAQLTSHFSRDEALPRIARALLHLDEAAIYTIHGFCKRVLTQQAFQSGISFNPTMEANTQQIELEAVRDWYRRLAADSASHLAIAVQWPTPESFLRAFARLVCSTISAQSSDPSQLRRDYLAHKQQTLTALQGSETQLADLLIDHHKQREQRQQEWQLLLAWCSEAESLTPMPAEAAAFLDGRRFGKVNRPLLQQLLAPAITLRTLAANIEDEIQTAERYAIVNAGISEIRRDIATAKQRQQLLNFDDLISQLATALHAPSGPQLAETLRGLYPVALVDEFQDTDPTQYSILDLIYRGEESALYMIGDPKQAIYAFRGGDVFAYLQARLGADQQWQMGINWRSSSAMIGGYNRLFSRPADHPSVFGFGIDYHAVAASPHADATPLHDAGRDSALQLIYFPYQDEFRDSRAKEPVMKQEFCPVIAHWCAAEIGRLLGAPARLGESPIQEHDIAILVRDRREAGYMQTALQQQGLASVYLSTRDNLFASTEALELVTLLRGIIELENERLFTAALSTRYMGLDAQALLQLRDSEQQWEHYYDTLAELRILWLQHGFMAMALQCLHRFSRPDPAQHERSLTNMLHLFELLQQASQRHRLPRQLLSWLQNQCDAPIPLSEAELRLESDANLIRIVTQHGCKGLEYPIVFIPFASRYKDPIRFGNTINEVLEYHDRDSYQPQAQLGYTTDAALLTREEGHAETIRLLYVAITRARSRCYLCATPFKGYEGSPLGATLGLTAGAELLDGMQQLVARSSGTIQLLEVDTTANAVPPLSPPPLAPMPLSAAPFNGTIERNWWLSSFTALTHNLSQGGISQPDRDQLSTITIEGSATTPPAPLGLRFTLTKGAATGNLLHDTLEQTDFSRPLWATTLVRPLARFGALADADQPQLIQWLDEVVATPLLGANETTAPRLADLDWGTTLRETEFYFPLQQLQISALQQLLSHHRGEPATLAPLSRRQLQGMMHGFIDLIFEWQGRYYVADYKSNWLGDGYDAYQPHALEQDMRRHNYDLQYLIYSLALHRYLQRRLPDYAPEQHLGGVYYLYLRGMHPQQQGGVYYHPLSPALLQQLDQLFGDNHHGD